MKNKWISLLTSILLLTGCSDWLDVSTRSETLEDEMFETEDGFKSALTGVYIKVASEQLYGAYSSFLLPEALTRHWSVNPYDQSTPVPALTEHDYEQEFAENLLREVWSQYYNAIAQLNNVLSNLDRADPELFHYGNENLIRGEALGLRALLHFDLLRLFGPVPDASAPSKPAIPYATELSTDPNKFLSISYSEVIRLIQADLEEAERTLAEYDPILDYANITLNTSGNYGTLFPDSWQMYRQRRLNYYAVLAIQARFHLWTGDREKAARYARQVVEAENPDGSDKFTLFQGTEVLTMYSENIFAAHNSVHATLVEKYFTVSNNNSYPLSQDLSAVASAYEVSLNVDDVRYAMYWNSNGVYLKYKGDVNEIFKPNHTIPVVRLGEMYLILAECLPIDQAREYFETFGRARKMDNSMFTLFDENNRIEMLENEYRKDFYGEGQMFAFYKRHNYSVFTYPTTYPVEESVYLLPKPENQTAFE
ncbi:MAG: RagB/SusD family nutrient uptake outer membrane protein [Rikenellaceae bacterium]|nr:RagB/SusD family nutrient uptake outer membrane protein [Rikenellaceae bacterium]